MGRFNILSKVDRALVAYLISEGAGSADDVLPGKLASDVPNPPYTVCFSDNGKTTHSPVYRVNAQIDVYTNSAPEKGENTEQMRLDSDERVSATFDAFHLQADDGQGGHALADAITEAAQSEGGDLSDFVVEEVNLGEMEQANAGKEGQWVDSLKLEIVCSFRNQI